MIEGKEKSEKVSPTKLSVTRQGSRDVRVFEFGARLDAISEIAALKQVRLAQELRSELYRVMQEAHQQSQDLIRDWAGPEFAALELRMQVARQAMREAAAKRDRAAWLEHRAVWRSETTRRVRWVAKILGERREVLKKVCYSRVGNKKGCDTYELRCAFVDRGLGWGTANKVLDDALVQWTTATKRGRAPRLSDGVGDGAMSLTLQFTTAGGIDVDSVMRGERLDLQLEPPAEVGPRCYGRLMFRLGGADANVHAEGTWQQHRAIPAGSRLLAARLVWRRAADRSRWGLQLMIRLVNPPSKPREKSGLIVVNTGWAKSAEGRRVAAMATGPGAGDSEVFVLPAAVEATMRRALALQRERDEGLINLLEWLQGPEFKRDVDSAGLREWAEAVRRARGLVDAADVYGLQSWLRECGIQLDRLNGWVSADRRLWQAAEGLARRARGRRRATYRDIASRAASSGEGIVFALPDTGWSAGDGGPGRKPHQGGRWVAALSLLHRELERAVRERGGVLLECASEDDRGACLACGSSTIEVDATLRTVLKCNQCGWTMDRRAHAAGWLWRSIDSEDDDVIESAKSERDRLALVRREDTQAKAVLRREGRLTGKARRRRAQVG